MQSSGLWPESYCQNLGHFSMKIFMVNHCNGCHLLPAVGCHRLPPYGAQWAHRRLLSAYCSVGISLCLMNTVDQVDTAPPDRWWAAVFDKPRCPPVKPVQCEVCLRPGNCSSIESALLINDQLISSSARHSLPSSEFTHTTHSNRLVAKSSESNFGRSLITARSAAHLPNWGCLVWPPKSVYKFIIDNCHWYNQYDDYHW